MVKQGREPQLRAVQAQSEVANAMASLDEAQAFRDAALARLAGTALLDAPVQSIDNSLLDRAPPLPRRYRTGGAHCRSRSRCGEQAGRRGRKRALPDLSVTAAQTRFREGGERAYNLGLSLSIPLFDRNRGGIRAANADQRAAEARLDQQRRDSEAARLSAVAGLKATGSRTRAADESVVAAEEAYRLARIGFDAGRISQLELRSTRSALIAARGAAVDARLSRVGAEIDLARLEGRAPLWRHHDSLRTFPLIGGVLLTVLLAGCAGNAQTPANEDPARPRRAPTMAMATRPTARKPRRKPPRRRLTPMKAWCR